MNSRRLAFLVSLCAITAVQAELLVIKQTDEGFAPLDAGDVHNKNAIASIFLNYEWPMVIANTRLTNQEMDELLTADRPNAEEEFFRAKVKEIDPHYDVVFVPTSMYELFALTKLKSSKKGPLNPLTAILADMQAEENSEKIAVPYALHNPFTDYNEPIRVTYERVFKQFRSFNNYFYPEAFFHVNSDLVEELFSIDGSLQASKDVTNLANRIRTTSATIAASLINKLPARFRVLIKHELDPDRTNIKPNGILAQAIALEYKARAINKAILWRGTGPVELTKGSGGGKLQHIHTTSRSGNLKELAQRTLEPFSISFGNSLFAGIIHDIGACAYDKIIDTGGYALFIDKKYYIKNLYAGFQKSLDLFFIAPLSNLAGLFAGGEFFHSRVKAAVPPIILKKGQRPPERSMIGVAYLSFIDRNGLLTTERDPLVHAEIFSKYLAKNMHPITKGDEPTLTQEEHKEYEEKLAEAQLQAGQYYKAIRKLQPFTKKFSAKVRKQLEEEKKKAASSKGETSSIK